MNKIYLILIFVFGVYAFGYSQETMLYVNNSIDDTSAIELRIYTPNLKNIDGFYIYRKSEGNKWQKLNSQPLIQKQSKDVGNELDSNAKQILDIFNSKENTNEGLIVLVLATYVIQNKALADATGTRYIDHNLTNNKSYTYKIVDAKTGKELAVSEPFVKGNYKPTPPPDSLKIYQKGNKLIAFEWEAKPLKFYGVNIYRAVNSQKAVKLNDKPILLSKIKNANGVEAWPKIKYADDDLKLGNEYTYQVEVLDYFGNSGQLSDAWIIDFKDIEPPPPTKGLFADIKDKEMTIDLKWKDNEAKDLMGYNVYYSKENDSTVNKINDKLVSLDSLQIKFKVDAPGKYNTWIEAIDSAGNSSNSDLYDFTILDKQAPEIPDNINFELKPKGKVVLNWQSKKSDDFMTYRVYRKEANAHHFVLITANDLDSNSYTDNIDLSVRNYFLYYVIAMDTLFNKSETSDTLVVKLPDLTPPSKPFLKKVSVVDNKYKIVWKENKEYDLAGYNVYFYNDIDTVKLNTQLINNQQFIDNRKHKETVLRYLITAVDSNSNESEYSNHYELEQLYNSMADGNFTKIKYKVNKQNKGVSISWKFKGKNQLMGFIVYRAGDDNKFKAISGLIKEKYFEDKKLKTGNFKYKIIALYSSGDKVKSEIKFITINK